MKSLHSIPIPLALASVIVHSVIASMSSANLTSSTVSVSGDNQTRPATGTSVDNVSYGSFDATTTYNQTDTPIPSVTATQKTATRSSRTTKYLIVYWTTDSNDGPSHNYTLNFCQNDTDERIYCKSEQYMTGQTYTFDSSNASMWYITLPENNNGHDTVCPVLQDEDEERKCLKESHRKCITNTSGGTFYTDSGSIRIVSHYCQNPGESGKLLKMMTIAVGVLFGALIFMSFAAGVKGIIASRQQKSINIDAGSCEKKTTSTEKENPGNEHGMSTNGTGRKVDEDGLIYIDVSNECAHPASTEPIQTEPPTVYAKIDIGLTHPGKQGTEKETDTTAEKETTGNSSAHSIPDKSGSEDQGAACGKLEAGSEPETGRRDEGRGTSEVNVKAEETEK